jgi:hypothetical protein
MWSVPIFAHAKPGTGPCRQTATIGLHACKGICRNERPTFTRRQLDDAMNVRGVDRVGFARNAVNELAVPTAVWIQVEHRFDIAAIEDFGVETSGVIMRCGVAEPCQS